MSDQAKIYIGTSGWSYPKGDGGWTGYFYPQYKVDELQYYSQFFKTVELNSSFYRPPSPALVEKWISRVPDDFLFTVKLWQKFTHPRMYKEASGDDAVIAPEDIDLFYNSLESFIKHGKLGALLAQFPPSFKNDEIGRRILRTVVKLFSKCKLAIELRHRSWSDDDYATELFKGAAVAWVQIDEPQFSNSIARDLPLTANVAYFRFHGRNREMWWKGNNETRYKYLYSLTEIEELASKVKTASNNVDQTFVFFKRQLHCLK